MSEGMENGGLSRRGFLKGLGAIGAAGMAPEVARSAENKRTTAEQVADLKAQVDDIQGRFERYKSIASQRLSENVGKTALPEFKKRISTAKDSAMELSAYIALMETETDRLNEVGDLYSILEGIEKEVESLPQAQ